MALNFFSRFIGKTLDNISKQTQDRVIKNAQKRANTPGTKAYESNQRVKKMLKEIQKLKEFKKNNGRKCDRLIKSLPKLNQEDFKNAVKEIKFIKSKIMKIGRISSVEGCNFVALYDEPTSIAYYRKAATKGGHILSSNGKKITLIGSDNIKKSKGMSKKEAMSKMKELKELYDLTVITQEEFELKSAPLKKIILKE